MEEGQRKKERKGEGVEKSRHRKEEKVEDKEKGGGKSGQSQKYIQLPDLHGTSPPAQRHPETLEISCSFDTT